jgi:hypothetical protein
MYLFFGMSTPRLLGFVTANQVTYAEYKIPEKYAGLAINIITDSNDYISKSNLPLRVVDIDKRPEYTAFTLDGKGRDSLQNLAELKARVDHRLAGIATVDDRGHVL